MVLFGLYLGILMLVGYTKYDSIASNASMSVSDAQRQLRDFYQTIIMMLAGMVSIVTPGLAATTIVMERQRRSLDLVFSAPVQPRYYLVGKMIAVYRYIWMLLILSLPVTAACVVLGGASWSDVLTVYGLLSMHGLLMATIGLMISTFSPKPVSAIVWSYIAVAGYLIVSGSGAGAAYAMVSFRSMGGSGGEAPFLVGINPFTAIYAVGTYTTIGATHVPNWLLASLAILVAVRLCLLGGGAVLSEGREALNLRLHWAILVSVLAFGLAYWLGASGAYRTIVSATPRGTIGAPVGADAGASILGYGLFWFFSPLLLVIPTLSAYGTDGMLRQRTNGWFGLRNALDGTPAGALPYLASLILLATAFVLVGIKSSGNDLPSVAFAYFVVFTLGFWSLFWAIGRVASSLKVGLRTARTAVVIGFVVLVILPVPFLMALSAETFQEGGVSLWNLYPLRPVLQFKDMNLFLPLAYGAAFLLAALGANLLSERRLSRTEAIRA